MKRIAALILCLLSLTALPLRAADITSNLDFQADLQDNAASTTLVATVGTNGALSSSTTAALTTTGPGGAYTRALSFSGVSGGITGTFSGPIITPAGPTTLSFWTLMGTQSSSALQLHPLLWHNFNNDGATGFSVETFKTGSANVNKLQVRCWLTGGVGITSGTYADSAWHHIAVTRTGTNGILYVDGTSVATATATTPSSPSVNDMYIGGDPGIADRKYAGSLAGIRVYSRVLAAGDITALIALGSSTVRVSRSRTVNLGGTGRASRGGVNQ